MFKITWDAILILPAFLGTTLLLAASTVSAKDLASSEITETIPETIASTQPQVTKTNLAEAPNQNQLTAPNNTVNPIETNPNENVDHNPMDQVTNVSQLRDVSPGDWAFEALRSLVERYGCIAGYPDGTFRGNRATSRFEFAAGLNACLNQVERLIQTSTADFVRKQDLETLQRLVSEFRTELTTLGARVDKLESRTAFLENHQFSTTTKLQGEAIFALTDEFNQPISNNTVLQDRVRLTFNTSFNGKDRLITRIAAGNGNFLSTRTNLATGGSFSLSEGQQTFDVGGRTNNNIGLDKLAYNFNFGSSKVALFATGGRHVDYAPVLNPYFNDGDDGGNGALSTLASQSPIYRIGGGAGAAVSFGVGPLTSILGPSTLTVGYLAGSRSFGANDPNEKAGLFDGNFAALGQLNVNVGDRFGIGATYVHGYHNAGTAIFDNGESGRAVINQANSSFSNGFGVVGSTLANNPSTFVSLFSRGLRPQTPVVTNSYGVEAAFRLTDNISLSGFGSYTDAILIGQGKADIWTYGGGVAFSDLGKQGNVLGLFAGVEPTLRGLSPGIRPTGGFSRDNVWHFEAFYKYKLNNNISVTPGVIWVTAPNQSDRNSDAVIGTLRTTFTF
ncbi:MAG: iron uptake porin [Coleofasciculaceae cyanobacterium]